MSRLFDRALLAAWLLAAGALDLVAWNEIAQPPLSMEQAPGLGHDGLPGPEAPAAAAAAPEDAGPDEAEASMLLANAVLGRLHDSAAGAGLRHVMGWADRLLGPEDDPSLRLTAHTVHRACDRPPARRQWLCAPLD